MANIKNLKRGNKQTQFKSGREAAENGKKGGIASGKSRREKKTIQKILTEYLNQDVSSQKAMKKIATECGVSEKQSIKELVAVACVLNTIKRGGDVDKLLKLCELLGEDNNAQEIEDISEAEADIFGGD